MKKLAAILLATLLSVASHQASAQSAQFVFTPVTPLTGVAPGANIVFDISLNVTTGGTLTDIAGLTYFLIQTTPAPFVFTIVGRDRTGSPFSDPITADSFFNITHDPLNPSNHRDLGALIDISAAPLPSGSYFIARITLQITGPITSSAVWTIQSTTTGGQRSIVNDSTGFVTFPIAPASLSIAIIPEPGTTALLVVGGLLAGGLGVARQRKA